ncbi:MAG: (d)CMP kinase [Spirochaetaceae bacterium]|nr:(d)CMP kinase [Spirochaetaceae bacterium]MBQ8353797.1 (d)CMP kinase [Spirochaetaceae bacterium]
MIIAIDGPAGTGKSTIAKLIAEKLNITFLNSGSFYRGITLALLKDNVDLSDEKKVLEFADNLDLDYVNEHLILNGEDVDHLLHQDIVDANASQVSSIVELRHIVNKKLRKITETQSVVCEGRDITTVVFPMAEYKFYLDASIDVQAQRRFNQGVSQLSLEEIKEAIRKRDELDKNKKEGSLKIAEDATYIDTSDLTIDNVCEIILSKIHI